MDEANGLLKLQGEVFPSLEDLLIFKVHGLVNPSFSTLSTIKITSYSDTDALNKIENSGFSNFSFETKPGSLLCIIEGVDRAQANSNPDLISSNVVAQNTDITVLFTVTHEVPQGGSFILEMPKWNSGTQKRGLERSSIHYEQPNSRNAQSVPCESDEHPDIRCTFAKTPVSESSEIATTLDVLTVTGLQGAILAD